MFSRLSKRGVCGKKEKMLITDLKLDTASEYMCNAELWPKACCDVMFDSDMLDNMAFMMLCTETGNGYIDKYALIDPERRLVVAFTLIYKKDNGTQDCLKIQVSELADSVEYYKRFEEQGKDEFKKFIAESCLRVASERAENTGCLVDVVDDFLENRDVRIPTSDRELEAEGEEPGAVRIYGPDYDSLAESFEATLKTDPQSAIKDRLKALQWWAEKYSPDELSFYTELIEDGFTLDEIESACGRDFADHTKAFWLEHGLM